MGTRSTTTVSQGPTSRNPKKAQKNGAARNMVLHIMGVSKIGLPQNGWFIMENPSKMDDWGYRYFWKHPYVFSSFGFFSYFWWDKCANMPYAWILLVFFESCINLYHVSLKNITRGIFVHSFSTVRLSNGRKTSCPTVKTCGETKISGIAVFPHLPVPYIFGTRDLVTWYNGNCELGSYIGNWKIRV